MENLLHDNFIVFLVLIVPGFVAIRVFDLLVPAERRDFSKSVVDVASFGAVNLVIARPLIRYVDPAAHPIIAYVVGVCIVVVGPAMIAIAWRRLLTAEFLRGKVIHPVPTAWDFFFLQARECWVLCHMKSGTKVGGWFGTQSFASGFPQRQEIYVEKLWRVDENGKFIEAVQRSGGAFVRSDECSVLEFFTVDGGKEVNNAKRATPQ